jgi:hypothetical protein
VSECHELFLRVAIVMKKIDPSDLTSPAAVARNGAPPERISIEEQRS